MMFLVILWDPFRLLSMQTDGIRSTKALDGSESGQEILEHIGNPRLQVRLTTGSVVQMN